MKIESFGMIVICVAAFLIIISISGALHKSFQVSDNTEINEEQNRLTREQIKEQKNK